MSEASEKSQFDSESARLAGIKSGISRRPIDKEVAATRGLKYLEDLMDELYLRIATVPRCGTCKRGGPIEVKVFASLAKSLIDTITEIQVRAWGRPAQESKFSREATLEEFKRLRKLVSSANSEDVPNDLPDPPQKS